MTDCTFCEKVVSCGFSHPFIMILLNFFLEFLQPDEESLLPQASQEGYQFDPNAQIPEKGFRF